MRIRMIIVVLLLVLVLGGVFGYKLFANHMRDQFIANMESPPVTVAAQPVEPSDWQPRLSVTGEVRAVQGVAISTEVAGIVRRIEFESGDTVSEGDLLVALDTSQDRARLEGLRADAKLSRTTLERKRNLRSRDLGSQAELDEASAQADQAAAEVAAQEALIDKKTIRAPFDGRLGIREVNIGEYVGPGTEMVSLQQPAPVYVDFSVPQERLAQVESGQTVVIRMSGYDEPFQGTVEAISPSLDRGTRTFRVRARVANEDERLRPGMYGNVQLQLGEPQPHLTVRQTAIAYNTYGDSVWVVVPREGEDAEGLTAKRRTVKTGETRGDQVQILDGLEEGDRVVVAGAHKLRPDATVKVDNDNLPSNEADPENVENY